MEPPVLEYARAERVGGDRYRWWFLLAGVPALVGTCVPIGSLGSLVGEIAHMVGQILKDGFAGKSMFAVAVLTAQLAPLSATIWRALRVRGSRPGYVVSIIGLALASIHVIGILGLLSGLMLERRLDATTIGAGVGTVVAAGCGVFFWRHRTWLDLGGWVLLVLVGVEMAFWALIGVIVVGRLGGNIWGVVFVATAVVRGVECAHLVRSRCVGQERA